MKKMNFTVPVLLGILAVASSCLKDRDEVYDYITFEELEPDPELGYWNGQPETGSMAETGFESGNASFPTLWMDTEWGPYWEGFAYSNHTNNDSGGIANQFSSAAGGGDEWSDNYAVFFKGFYGKDTLTFRQPELLDRMSLSNTAYTAYAMLDGDGFIYLKGRHKDMLLGPSGQNIYPEEIEAKLNNMPYVEESLVIEKEKTRIGIRRGWCERSLFYRLSVGS